MPSLVGSEMCIRDREELKAGKKQEAENALQAWKDGDATEESFAALANKLSEDPGSNTNGGLYKQVYKGQMVSEFNDWCFDESRKAGDTGIVANDAGIAGLAAPVSYTHLRAHETRHDLVCRLLLEKKKKKKTQNKNKYKTTK